MKIREYNGLKGYFFSPDDWNRVQKLETEEGVFYFLPYKWQRGKGLDKDQVIAMINKHDTKQQIIDEMGIKLLQLNNFMNRTWGTMNLVNLKRMKLD